MNITSVFSRKGLALVALVAATLAGVTAAATPASAVDVSCGAPSTLTDFHYRSLVSASYRLPNGQTVQVAPDTGGVFTAYAVSRGTLMEVCWSTSLTAQRR